MNHIILQCFTGTLEAAEHGAATAEKYFALKQTFGNWQITKLVAALFHPVNAQCHMDATGPAPFDLIKQIKQIEDLRPV